MGARFLTHGADILMVKAGLEHIQMQFGQLGITFDNRLDDAATPAKSITDPKGLGSLRNREARV
jgi:hypothetical protein